MHVADPRVQRIIDAFERLAPADVVRLGEWYAPGARFKDPFNEVVGVAAIQRIFGRMFERLEDPRFLFRSAVVQDDQCFLSWDFSFGRKRPLTIHGGSHLVLAADGRISGPSTGSFS